MPKNGFTKMFENMLDNKNIDVSLNTDFFKIRNSLTYKKLMIYTGEPDRFFKFKYGKLKWRSLKFKFRNFKKNLSKIVFNIIFQMIMILQDL